MKRRLDQSIIDELKKSVLWNKKLKDDCNKGSVFMAVRDNRIDFYHGGGKLFGFDKNGFRTHIKYAAVINGDDEKLNYLTEDKLADCKLIDNFVKGYGQIKKNCSNYAGVEARGVSKVLKKNSYLSDNEIVVLDIEVSFESVDEDRNQDRIDMVLLNKNTGALKFVEVKHFSNGEIWSTTTPKVIKQVERYENQIAQGPQSIVDEYAAYTGLINSIFDVKLPRPTSVEPRVKLLIFDFDNDQKYGRLKSLIADNPKYKAIESYHIGNVGGIKLKELY